MEGILREKFELTDTDWKKARRLHGMLRVEDFLDDAAGDKANKIKEMPPNRSKVDEVENVGNEDYVRTKVFRGSTEVQQNDSTIELISKPGGSFNDRNVVHPNERVQIKKGLSGVDAQNRT